MSVQLPGFLGKVQNVIQRGIDRTIPKPRNNVQSFVVPSTAPSSIGKSIGTVAKSGVNVVKRLISNPFAGRTLKEGTVNLGKNAAKLGVTGAAFGSAFEVNRALASGTPPTFENIVRAAAHGASFGLSPLGALMGYGTGTTEKVISKVNNGSTNILDAMGWGKKNPVTDLGMNKMSELDIMQNQFKGLLDRIPQSIGMQPVNIGATNFSMSPPVTNIEMPSSSFGGFSPTISAGGGMGEILPLILAMGGIAGVTGYAIGKKRRKKKYKKRKRRK